MDTTDPYRNIPKSVSLEKKHLDYIEQNELSLTDVTRDAVEKLMTKGKKTKKLTTIQHLSQAIVILGIGAVFLVVASNSALFLAWTISFLIGVFCLVYGAILAISEIKKYGG